MITTHENDNYIYVGDKPFMNYVAAIVMQFATHEQERVIVKARGKHMSRAIDIAEVAVQDFLKDQVEFDVISTESNLVQNREGRDVRVSTLDIKLKKL